MLKIFAVLFILLSTPALADSVIKNYIPDAKKIGGGRLTYMVWDVYDATLFAPLGQWSNDKPYALKLSYLRDINGKDITDASIKTIRDQGAIDEVKLTDWQTQMENIFPDVTKGTDIIGILTDNGATSFYKDGENIGLINDPEFGQYFFNIWLGEDTQKPKLRDQLFDRKPTP